MRVRKLQFELSRFILLLNFQVAHIFKYLTEGSASISPPLLKTDSSLYSLAFLITRLCGCKMKTAKFVQFFYVYFSPRARLYFNFKGKTFIELL